MAAIPPPKLCVFDLDGTLVNSLRDVAESVNHCLDMLGLPQHPIDSYRYMVGEGVPALCRRAIGETYPHYLNRLIEIARPCYRVRALLHTQPYDGIRDLVNAIHSGGIRLAVLSNKPHDMTERIVRRFWPNGEFEFIQGYFEERLRKPDPQCLLRICASAQTSPEETCFVGDTPTDVLTASNAGTDCVAVTWGFRTRDDLLAAGAKRLVSTPRELLSALRLG